MCCVMGYTGHDLSAAKFKEYLLRTVMRGPDDQRVVEGPFGLMGFGRLAIMGLTPEGMQPFYRGADCVVCNGELYGFRFEKEILKRRGYKFASDCDCEILLPLYYEYGLDMFRHMDSEFALILYDSRKDRLIAARDPIGIRPLFYGYSKSSHQIAFASEMQNLIGWCDDIRPFPIGSYYCDGRFVRYEDIADVPAPMEDDMPTILKKLDKFKTLFWCNIVNIILGLVIFFVGYENRALFLTLTCVRTVPMSIVGILAFMFTPDCAEYGQYKSGISAKGITFAIQTFSVKITAAVSSSLALALLGCFHWISVEAESFEMLKALNIQQSAGALEGLWIVYALVPVIGMIISTFFYLGYKLNDKDVQIMARCNAGEITREEAESMLSRKY